MDLKPKSNGGKAEDSPSSETGRVCVVKTGKVCVVKTGRVCVVKTTPQEERSEALPYTRD